MSQSELKIPLAFDKTGNPIRPGDAIPGADYSCPGCGSTVYLRGGSNCKVVRHFSHLPSSACSSETILHQIGKRIICRGIDAWRAGNGISPHIHRTHDCGHIRIQRLPSKVVGATEEFRLPNGRIVDVALMGIDGPVAAVEIHVTHRVNATKAENLKLPFIELEAENLIADGLNWYPIQDHFKRWICKPCFERKALYPYNYGCLLLIGYNNSTTAIEVPPFVLTADQRKQLKRFVVGRREPWTQTEQIRRHVGGKLFLAWEAYNWCHGSVLHIPIITLDRAQRAECRSLHESRDWTIKFNWTDYD